MTSGLDILPNVGADVGDGLTTFDVEYQFNRLVNTAKIDVETKSIVLELKGNPRNDDNTLTLMLPSALISGISSISIDGQTTKTFTQKTEGDITILTIESILPFQKYHNNWCTCNPRVLWNCNWRFDNFSTWSNFSYKKEQEYKTSLRLKQFFLKRANVKITSLLHHLVCLLYQCSSYILFSFILSQMDHLVFQTN